MMERIYFGEKGGVEQLWRIFLGKSVVLKMDGDNKQMRKRRHKKQKESTFGEKRGIENQCKE